MKVEFYIITEKGAAKTVLQNEKHGEEEIFFNTYSLFHSCVSRECSDLISLKGCVLVMRRENICGADHR